MGAADCDVMGAFFFFRFSRFVFFSPRSAPGRRYTDRGLQRSAVQHSVACWRRAASHQLGKVDDFSFLLKEKLSKVGLSLARVVRVRELFKVEALSLQRARMFALGKAARARERVFALVF